MAMDALALGRSGREPATRDSRNLPPQMNERKGCDREIKILRYFAIKLAVSYLVIACRRGRDVRETGRAVMIWPPG